MVEPSDVAECQQDDTGVSINEHSVPVHPKFLNQESTVLG